MNNTDFPLFIAINLILISFSIFSFFIDFHFKKKEKHAEAIAEVNRGKESMNNLYTVYLATMASALVIIDNVSGVDGHKVFFIFIDFLCITYVFFFNDWFRNSLFFPIKNQMRKG